MTAALDGRYTIHDILTTLLNLTVVEYFKEVNPKFLRTAKKKKMSIQYPMNMRPPTFDIEKEGTSNGYLSAGIYRLSFNYRSRLELLRYVKGDLDLVRRSAAAQVVRRAAKYLEWTYNEKKFRKQQLELNHQHTLLLSNNKGPDRPYYIMGTEVEDIFGFALTQTPNLFGVFSYKGLVRCSITLDGGREPDVQRLARYWNSEFDQLYRDVMESAGTQ